MFPQNQVDLPQTTLTVGILPDSVALVRRLARWLAQHPQRRALKEAFDVEYFETLREGVAGRVTSFTEEAS